MGIVTTFQHRPFAALWSAKAVSKLGDSIHELALLWLVLQVTGDPLMISAVVVATVLPNVLVAIPAGTFVDRFNRRSILITTHLVRGLAVLAIPFVGHGPHLIPTILAVAFVVGLMQPFAKPAQSAMIPNTVPEEKLDSANALMGLTANGARMLYIVGGGVVAFLGAFPAFYINSTTFVVASVLLLVVPSTVGEPEREETEKSGLKQIVTDAKEGFQFVYASTLLASLVFTALLIGMLADSLGIVIPVLVEEVIEGGSIEYGLLLASLFAGMSLGGLILSHVGDRTGPYRGWLMVGGLSLAGCALILGAVLPTRVGYPAFISVGAFVMFGLALSMTTVPLNSTVQAVVPNDLRGRVFAVFTVVGLMGPPVGVAAAGVFVSVFGSATTLLLIGISMAGAGLFLLALAIPQTVVKERDTTDRTKEST